MREYTKIIIVTPWFGEFAGGAEVQAKGLALEFNKRGIETIVFTTCCKSPYSDWWTNYYDEGEYEVYGIKTFRFSVNSTKTEYEDALGHFIHHPNLMTEDRYRNFFVAGINSENLINALSNYLEKNYEVIAMPYYQGLTHSVVNAYLNKISIIPCFHNEDPFYWKPVEDLINNSKYIFFNSLEEKELCIKEYGYIGKKLIESSVTGEGVEQKDLIGTGNISLPEKYYIYMGRKEEGKNVHKLVEWFEIYKTNCISEIKLVFIGGGDNSLIPINEYFIDLGYVSEYEKKVLLENAIALINLSENESFSIVIMEAWLNNLPVIVNGKCDVTKGHSIRASAGVYPSNIAEFVKCLEYLEKNETIRVQMGANGNKYVKQNMTYDTVLEKYLNVLESK